MYQINQVFYLLDLEILYIHGCIITDTNERDGMI